jgi:hypothetical protein
VEHDRNKVVEDAGLKVSNDEIVDRTLAQNHGPVQHAQHARRDARIDARNTPTLLKRTAKLRERVRGHSGRESAGKPARLLLPTP